MCVHLSMFPWIRPTKTKPSSRRTSCAATCILLPKVPMSGGQHPKAKADSSLRLAALQQPVTWEPHVAPTGLVGQQTRHDCTIMSMWRWPAVPDVTSSIQ
jgi:hypothetical protein